MKILILLVLLLTGTVHAEVDLPQLSRRVTDLTSTLNVEQIQLLESRLAALEAQNGAQLAVLIVPTTQPEGIEQFGIRVAEAWRLGRKGVDDGALLLIARDDHALRIEVGYGLEGVLNDATAHRIIDELIVPRFKRGEFSQGIEAGLSAMIQVVSGEPLPPVARVGQQFESLMLPALVIAVALGGLLRALIGRLPAALLVGSVLGGVAWLMLAYAAVALLVGLVAFVLVLLGGGTGRSLATGGFAGGGGFGGGGGGFGGGGASGRW